MNNSEITSSLRISSDSNHASTLTAPEVSSALERLGSVSRNKDESVLVVDLDAHATAELDQTLERSIAAAVSARASSELLDRATITAWITISCSQEFVGVALPEELVKKAAEARVSLVFSIYANQQDLETI